MSRITCPRCFGNGYIKIPHESVEKLNKPLIAQCTMCNSEGEIEDKKIEMAQAMFSDTPTAEEPIVEPEAEPEAIVEPEPVETTETE